MSVLRGGFKVLGGDVPWTSDERYTSYGHSRFMGGAIFLLLLGFWVLGRGVVSPGHLMGVIPVMATPDLWERPYFGLILTPFFPSFLLHFSEG